MVSVHHPRRLILRKALLCPEARKSGLSRSQFREALVRAGNGRALLLELMRVVETLPYAVEEEGIRLETLGA